MCCSAEDGLSRRWWLGLAAGLCGFVRAEDARLLPPRDESAQDPALAALLQKIRELAAGRDFRGLEALMAPDFRVEFDAGKGPRAFHAHWRPDSSDRLWRVLSRLLPLGGTFYRETLFAIPYVYTRFPFDLGLMDHVVAVKENAALLEKAEPDAKRVGTLAYAVVPLAEPLKDPVVMEDARYLRVDAPGAGMCFVAAADVYSPAAHRAFFEKRQGRWRWISLAAATLNDPPMPKGSVQG
jgi:hypothetical protein